MSNNLLCNCFVFDKQGRWRHHVLPETRRRQLAATHVDSEITRILTTNDTKLRATQVFVRFLILGGMWESPSLLSTMDVSIITSTYGCRPTLTGLTLLYGPNAEGTEGDALETLAEVEWTVR